LIRFAETGFRIEIRKNENEETGIYSDYNFISADESSSKLWPIGNPGSDAFHFPLAISHLAGRQYC